MSSEPAPPALSVHELRRLGGAYLQRANAAMEHARRSRAGDAYAPLPETAAEHAGQYVLSGGTLRRALQTLDYQLRHLDPGENGTLWREARAVLVAAIRRAEGAGAAVPEAPEASPA